MLRRILLAVCLSSVGFAQTTTVADEKPPVARKTVDDALASAYELLDKGKFDEADAAFKSLVDKDPKSVEAEVGLIRSLSRHDKFDEAQAAAKNAAAILPQSALLQATAGDLAFRMGKLADAEAGYRAALKLDPDSARGLYGMARMFQMVSMRKMARKALDKAHELDPDDRQIYSRWFATLSYAEQLAIVKKAAGEHPTERQQIETQFLTTAVQKKPWTLASPMQSATIKMEPYGRKLSATGGADNRLMMVGKGFGLSVKFNDKASAVLLLDTGAGGITIGRKLGERAGAVKIAEGSIGGIGDQGRVDAYSAWVDKINIGGLEFTNCIVEVSSKSDVADEAGLIGADVFSKFLVTLDFKEWTMQLAPLPKIPDAAGDDDQLQDRYIAPEMKSFTKIWRFRHNLVIPVQVSDKVMGNFILDTGADTNLATPQLARQITKVDYEGGSIHGVSGRVKEVLNGDKAILQFGQMRVRSDDIPVVDLTNISNSAGTEIAGFIGIKTLVQTKFTIDYRDGLVNFEPYERKPARE